MKSKIGLIIGREYFERVSKKSFIITTILMPVLMLLLMAAPALIMMFASPDRKVVYVEDRSGLVAPRLTSDEEVTFKTASLPVDTLVAHGDFDAIVLIPDSVVSGRSVIQLYSNGPSSMSLESNISRQINDIVETERLKQYNIENLDEILKEVQSDVTINTVRTDREGDDSTASAGVSYGVGMVLTFILYMFLLLYGQMVMNGIIEEKNNRVLEVVVSSVKPTQLMMGKILGIGLVAVTQILLWCVLMTALAAFLFPVIMPAEAMNEVSQLQAGTLDMSLYSGDELAAIQGVSLLGNVGFILKIFGWMTLFLIGGFLFYATMYAAIGASVDNVQDAGQLSFIVVMPVLIGLIVSTMAAADPNTSLAFWLSIVPFTSPMVMMSRIPSGIPEWEIIVSAVVLFLSFLGMVWVAAKIYRVGIFMHGKKPNIKDLAKWIKYK